MSHPNNNDRMFVVTGGPGSGKTALLNALETAGFARTVEAGRGINAVADTLVRLSWLAHDLGPRLQDLEINPLIVRVAGKGAVAVDGRGTLTA